MKNIKRTRLAHSHEVSIAVANSHYASDAYLFRSHSWIFNTVYFNTITNLLRNMKEIIKNES